MTDARAHDAGMTPEQFYERVREILKDGHPDVELHFLV